jgi:hypothetical protein
LFAGGYWNFKTAVLVWMRYLKLFSSCSGHAVTFNMQNKCLCNNFQSVCLSCILRHKINTWHQCKYRRPLVTEQKKISILEK